MKRKRTRSSPHTRAILLSLLRTGRCLLRSGFMENRRQLSPRLAAIAGVVLVVAVQSLRRRAVRKSPSVEGEVQIEARQLPPPRPPPQPRPKHGTPGRRVPTGGWAVALIPPTKHLLRRRSLRTARLAAAARTAPLLIAGLLRPRTSLARCRGSHARIAFALGAAAVERLRMRTVRKRTRLLTFTGTRTIHRGHYHPLTKPARSHPGSKVATRRRGPRLMFLGRRLDSARI
jgi:hypothetical protein